LVTIAFLCIQPLCTSQNQLSTSTAIKSYHQFLTPDRENYLTVEVNENLVELWVRKNPNFCSYGDKLLGSLDPSAISSYYPKNVPDDKSYSSSDREDPDINEALDAVNLALEISECVFWTGAAGASAGAVGASYGATLTGVGILPATIVIPFGSISFLYSTGEAAISCSQAVSDLLINIDPGAFGGRQNEPIDYAIKFQGKVAELNPYDLSDLNLNGVDVGNVEVYVDKVISGPDWLEDRVVVYKLSDLGAYIDFDVQVGDDVIVNGIYPSNQRISGPYLVKLVDSRHYLKKISIQDPDENFIIAKLCIYDSKSQSYIANAKVEFRSISGGTSSTKHADENGYVYIYNDDFPQDVKFNVIVSAKNYKSSTIDAMGFGDRRELRKKPSNVRIGLRRSDTEPSPKEQFELRDHIMAKDVSDSNDPVTKTTTFSTEDEKAVSWLNFYPDGEAHDIEWKWFSPNGDLVKSRYGDSHLKETNKNPKCWDWIDIGNLNSEQIQGDWRVDVYVDGEFYLKKTFKIEATKEEHEEGDSKKGQHDCSRGYFYSSQTKECVEGY
jgi:hypothetical protein